MVAKTPPGRKNLEAFKRWARKPVNAIPVAAIAFFLALFPVILRLRNGSILSRFSLVRQILTNETYEGKLPAQQKGNYSCSTTSPDGPLYEIDPLSYGKPETFDGVNEVFECDCSHWRSNVCTLKGDVRIDASKNYLVLYAKEPETRRGIQVMKPYTRKWEVEMMQGVHDVIIKSMDAPEGLQPWVPTVPTINSSGPRNGTRGIKPFSEIEDWDTFTIQLGNLSNWSEEEWHVKMAKRLWFDETQLSEIEWRRENIGQKLLERGGLLGKEGPHAWVVFNESKRVTEEEMKTMDPVLKCDVNHSVPGIVFANSGWTGNIYHEFNDGLIPLYITANRFQGEFVMILTQAKLWWFVKYEFVLKKLSNYPVVLLGQEELVHCFQHVIVGLRIHDELTVYPQLLPTGNGSIVQFQELLRQAWGDKPISKHSSKKPEMCILSRSDKTRVISNEVELVALSEKLGLRVRELNPTNHADLRSIFRALQSCDVTLGVHGAAMTHLLFLRPNTSLIQILPLGTDWPAKTYYGDPAIRLGLHYLEYKIDIEESSLSKEYPKNHSVLLNPDSVRVEKGWWEFKEIFLERQNVTLNLTKMEGLLHHVLVQQYNFMP